MQRHVNDWVGTLKAAIPFLQILQCSNEYTAKAMEGQTRKNLAEVLNEARDIVEAAEAALKMAPKQPQTLVQELTSLINRRSLENGSDTPDFILADLLSRCLVTFDDCIKQRTKLYGLESFNKSYVQGGGETRHEKAVDQKRKDYKEKTAEALRATNARPFGAGPAIVPGLKFSNVHMPGYKFEVVDNYLTPKDHITVYITKGNEPASGWSEHWNIEHTGWGFERGEYWQINEEEKPGIDVEIARKVANEADALKKRQFCAGGEMPRGTGCAKNIDLVAMRKEAAREIIADMEKETAETLHGFKQTIGYMHGPLWEEFNQTNTILAKMWHEGQYISQEYKQLQQKANDLAEEIMRALNNEVVEKEAESMARIVADVSRVSEGFIKAAQALKVFLNEEKESNAICAKWKRMAKAIQNNENPAVVARNSESDKDANADIKKIDTNTVEGQLLMAAIALITGSYQTNRTPFEVLSQLLDLQKQMYEHANVLSWDFNASEPVTRQGVQCVKCGDWYEKGIVCKNCFIDENRKCGTR
jgi:hypothetical protein